jgi:hypothetical protein
MENTLKTGYSGQAVLTGNNTFEKFFKFYGDDKNENTFYCRKLEDESYTFGSHTVYPGSRI